MTIQDSEITETSSTVPGLYAFEITPHDSNELSHITRGIYVGTGGNLKVTMAANNVVTFTNVPSGAFLPIRCRLIFSAGTTASDIVGVY